MQANQTMIFAAFDLFAATTAEARITLVSDLKAAGVTTLEDARQWGIRWVCAKTGAAFNESKGGKLMLDSKHAKYEKAKTALRDLLLAFEGKKREGGSSGSADPVAALLKKYAELTPAQKRAFKAAI